MKRNKTGCDLASCMFCRLCKKEWLLAVAVKRETFFVKKGEEIFKEGDPVAGIYFVNSGVVKVHKKWGIEKELILRFATNGAIVGHRGLGKESIFPVSATAIEPSEVCFIDLSFFDASLHVNHDFLYSLMLFFAEELKQSERKMRDMVHMPVKGRIAGALLQLQEQFGINENGFINIILSRQDLASFAGTTYETVFRILSEFAEEGYIKSVDKELLIANKEALQTISASN